MKKDLRSVVLKVAKFLDKTLSDDEIEKLLDHLNFNSMKNNPNCENIKKEHSVLQRQFKMMNCIN